VDAIGCCGEKRAALKRSPGGEVLQERAAPAGAAPSEPPVPPAPSAAEVVVVEYLERSSIRVRGPVTGAQYAFSGAEPVQRVDRRDAPALLGTPYFRRRA
jgi:hypothetical protein